MKKVDRRPSVPFEELLAEMPDDPESRENYDLAGVEIELAMALNAAREAAGLTQAQLAKKLHTKQQSISRLEMANQNVTIRTLHRHVRALGARLEIRVVRPDDPVVKDASERKPRKRR